MNAGGRHSLGTSSRMMLSLGLSTGRISPGPLLRHASRDSDDGQERDDGDRARARVPQHREVCLRGPDHRRGQQGGGKPSGPRDQEEETAPHLHYACEAPKAGGGQGRLLGYDRMVTRSDSIGRHANTLLSH